MSSPSAKRPIGFSPWRCQAASQAAAASRPADRPDAPGRIPVTLILTAIWTEFNLDNIPEKENRPGEITAPHQAEDRQK
jgi:hypothetical protein